MSRLLWLRTCTCGSRHLDTQVPESTYCTTSPPSHPFKRIKGIYIPLDHKTAGEASYSFEWNTGISPSYPRCHLRSVPPTSPLTITVPARNLLKMLVPSNSSNLLRSLSLHNPFLSQTMPFFALLSPRPTSPPSLYLPRISHSSPSSVSQGPQYTH